MVVCGFSELVCGEPKDWCTIGPVETAATVCPRRAGPTSTSRAPNSVGSSQRVSLFSRQTVSVLPKEWVYLHTKQCRFFPKSGFIFTLEAVSVLPKEWVYFHTKQWRFFPESEFIFTTNSVGPSQRVSWFSHQTVSVLLKEWLYFHTKQCRFFPKSEFIFTPNSVGSSQRVSLFSHQEAVSILPMSKLKCSRAPALRSSGRRDDRVDICAEC